MSRRTSVFSGSGTLLIASGWLANQNNTNTPTVTMSMGSGANINIASGAELFNGGWQDITWADNLASLTLSGTLDTWDGLPIYVNALNRRRDVNPQLQR